MNNTKIYILRVFETHVKKPQSYKVFSKKKVYDLPLTQYGFYVNQLPYQVVLPDSTKFDSEEAVLFFNSKTVSYIVYYTTKKHLINHTYLKHIRNLKNCLV